ncbi:esterase/lipase family protein [Vulgatibacter sp.]|uniref:esterase/lipase family protein n=1 Tax=Vulgatibacter sp. TaxID=1971226 RepID=UPI003568BA0F
MGQKLDFALAVLNGAIGDHLDRTGNGLATEMAFVRAGASVPAAAAAPAEASGRLVVLVHGLMCTETVWRQPDGGDFGSQLERDLGYTPLYLRYNSGRSLAENGAALARLLEELIDTWPVPVEEILPLGYSMGGLVVRSACHVAARAPSRWLGKVRRAIYVGTPHRGTPLERLGRLTTRVLRGVDDPYTRLIAELGDLRSDGIKDLGDADLRHEDRTARLSLRDRRHPVPLLPSMEHFLVAGARWTDPRIVLLFGDAMVPLPSATDGACATPQGVALPPDHVHIVPGIAHIDLPRRVVVYEAIRRWCER